MLQKRFFHIFVVLHDVNKVFSTHMSNLCYPNSENKISFHMEKSLLSPSILIQECQHQMMVTFQTFLL